MASAVAVEERDVMIPAAEIEDLMTGQRFVWTGKLQHVRLDPAALPFAIWRATPFGRSAP